MSFWLVAGEEHDLLALVGFWSGGRAFPGRLRAGVFLHRRLGVSDAVGMRRADQRGERDAG